MWPDVQAVHESYNPLYPSIFVATSCGFAPGNLDPDSEVIVAVAGEQRSVLSWFSFGRQRLRSTCMWRWYVGLRT